MKHMKNGQEINTLVSAAVEDLTNVEIDNLSDGQVLEWNATTQKWENANGGGGGASDLDDLSDVEITNPTNGQVLAFNSTTSKWENSAGGSGSDTNVTQTEISTNDDYEVLLSGTADDQTRTEGANKSENVKVNPSTGNVTIAGTLTDKNGLQTVRSLTGAEYDALSSAEKNNGTYYHLTDRNSTNVLDVNVSQTATSTDATYEVLFSGSADNVTKVEGARKNSNLTFNPSTGSLGVGGKLTVGAQPTNNMDVTTKQYVDNLIDTAITQVLDTIY